MLQAVCLFIVGLLLLIKGGDWFVDAATGIANRFHIPDVIIGATVVSIGTTLPEVLVSATSAAKGIGDMAFGNAIGSIICNAALIAAITIAVRPSNIERKSLRLPVIFFFVAAIIYACAAYISGEFSLPMGIVLLAIFVIYMTIVIVQSFKNTGIPTEEEKEESVEKPLWMELILLVVGAAAIAIGANLLVNNGTIIATGLGVPQSVVALTFVALGTSLPELVTAITSLVKGHGSLSLGNVIGANLFNLVLVSGVAVTISPFKVPVGNTVAGMNASLVVDIPVMFLVMIILTIPSLIRGKLSRIQGILLLGIYVSYCIFQFVG